MKIKYNKKQRMIKLTLKKNVPYSSFYPIVEQHLKKWCLSEGKFMLKWKNAGHIEIHDILTNYNQSFFFYAKTTIKIIQ
jgi:hypothetical protein